MISSFKRILSTVCATVLLCSAGCAPSTPSPTPSTPLATTASVKVMSWNILNPSWGGLPADMRIEAFVKNIAAETPDILGIQEASQKWHDEFAAMPKNYIAANAVTASGKAAMTMFFYNSDTLELIESGIVDLDTNSDIRIVSWAVMGVKNTAVKFLITNTHPDSREAPCIAHTQQYLQIVDKLYLAKGLPMLNVGDFNAIEKSTAYRLHIADGFTDCKYADGVTLLQDIDSYLKGDFGGQVTTGLGSRDHVFFKGNITPTTFTTLSENDVRDVSDHLPVVAVVTINE